MIMRVPLLTKSRIGTSYFNVGSSLVIRHFNAGYQNDLITKRILKVTTDECEIYIEFNGPYKINVAVDNKDHNVVI